MRYIALEGPIGHGKSTFAQMLQKAAPQSVHLESSTVITEVANAFQDCINESVHFSDIEALNKWLLPLPGILKDIVRVDTKVEALTFNAQDVNEQPRSFEKLFDYARMIASQPDMLHQDITPANKSQFRGLLQWLGGYLSARVDEEIWFSELVRRCEEADTQQPPQETLEFGILSAVRMPGDERVMRRIGGHIVRIIRPAMIAQDLHDPTESSRQLIHPDTVVHNDGTLSDLRPVATELMNDIRTGTLRGIYFAEPPSSHQ